MHCMKRRTLLAALTALPMMTAVRAAASYPNRPIILVLPFPAGGQTDMVARLLAQKLEPLLGQSVIVENRPGANSLIGTNYVARSPADGHTLLFNMTALVSNPILLPNIDYDPFTQFQPVFRLYRIPAIWAVPANGPGTLAEFIEKAKSAPQPLTFATTGHASSSHYFGEMFAKASGIRLNHIPYKGESLILPDLLGERLDAAVVSSYAALHYGKDGRLRSLAASGKDRWQVLPDVPTFDELGVKGTGTETFAGIFLTTGTPPSIVERLNEAMTRASEDTDFRARLLDNGLEVAPPLSAEAFLQVMRDAHRDWVAAKQEFDIQVQ